MKLVTSKRSPVVSVVEEISPDQAAEYLKFNKGNRRVVKSQVKFLAATIRNNEWVLTHQGIAFDENGKLVDGQHRLFAIIEAGATVPMVVTRGLDQYKAFLVTDIGRMRNTADLFNIDQRVATCVNFFTRALENNRTTSFRKMEVYDSLGPLIEELVEHCGATRRVFSSTSVKCAAVFQALVKPEDKEYIFDLYSSLVKGALEGMPKVGQAFVNGVLTGNISTSTSNGTSQKGLFFKSLYVFDRAKRDSTKIGSLGVYDELSTWTRQIIDEKVKANKGWASDQKSLLRVSAEIKSGLLSFNGPRQAEFARHVNKLKQTRSNQAIAKELGVPLSQVTSALKLFVGEMALVG
jgi:hypothetical protein